MDIEEKLRDIGFSNSNYVPGMWVMPLADNREIQCRKVNGKWMTMLSDRFEYFEGDAPWGGILLVVSREMSLWKPFIEQMETLEKKASVLIEDTNH